MNWLKKNVYTSPMLLSGLLLCSCFCCYDHFWNLCAFGHSIRNR
jgi:hypothetical protein